MQETFIYACIFTLVFIKRETKYNIYEIYINYMHLLKISLSCHEIFDNYYNLQSANVKVSMTLDGAS